MRNTFSKSGRVLRIWPVVFILICLLKSSLVEATPFNNLPDSLTSIQNSQDAIRQLNKVNYEASEAYCRKALARNPKNPEPYYVLSVLGQRQLNWDQAIEYAEKCIKTDPKYTIGYTNLFNAYFGAAKWEEAVKAGTQALEMDPNANIQPSLAKAKQNLANEGRSNVFVVLILFCLAIAVFYLLFAPARKGMKPLSTADTGASFIEIILVAATVSFILWQAFFAMAGWVRSINPTVSASELTPNFSYYIFEHDGIENIVLLGLILVNILVTKLLSGLILRFRLNKEVYRFVCVAMLAISALYFF